MATSLHVLVYLYIVQPLINIYENYIYIYGNIYTYTSMYLE